MMPEQASYRRHPSPVRSVSHAVWLFCVSSLGLRDVWLTLADRRVGVTDQKALGAWSKFFIHVNRAAPPLARWNSTAWYPTPWSITGATGLRASASSRARSLPRAPVRLA